jgi:basic membrane lipoprotein Med (substrate-binding protein (PBP1-ABC) superfamily)
MRAAPSASAVALAIATASCTLLVDASLKSPIGARCSSHDECQGAACADGLCAKSCATDVDCPGGSSCLGALCQIPLRVGALWSGVGVGGDGWTHTHKTGLDDTVRQLKYVEFGSQAYVFREEVRTSEQIQKGVDDLVALGADVIVATSLSQRDDILKKADEYPHTKFLTCGGFKPNGKNVGSFFGRYEQGWYVGGRVAALKAKKRLGYIAPLSTPGVVRFINAFTRGAQSVNPGIVVEVRWLGFWKDLHDVRTYDYKAKNFGFTTTASDPASKIYREELLAASLIDDGCELVVHETDTQRSVAFIDGPLRGMGADNKPVYAMAVDIRDGCRIDGAPEGRWMPSCLGAIYWNWSALYVPLLDEMHRGTWQPENLIEPLHPDPQTSPLYFALNVDVGIASEELQSTIVRVSGQDYRALYQGPYAVTGQRDRDGDGQADTLQEMSAGEIPTEEELGRMCWFATGVVEKSDPSDPSSPDRPAHVPDGPAGKFPPPADALEYEQLYPFIDPAHEMNCPQNL